MKWDKLEIKLVFPEGENMKKIFYGLSGISSSMLFPRVKPTGRLGRIALFPLVRVIWALFFIAPVILLHNLLLDNFLLKIKGPLGSWIVDAELGLMVVVIFLCFRFYARLIEQRHAHELSLAKGEREFGSGILVSFLLVAAMVLLLTASGAYHVERFNPWTILLHSAFIFAAGAFMQELLFRLVVFKLLEEWLGTWIAVAIIAAFFALAHLGNPNATPWTSLSLAFSDILLSASFVLTRRIWLVWGIHAGWNFFQAGVFGMANSGIVFKSWITAKIDGPAWLSGGAFGIEASVIAVLLNLVLGLFLLKLAQGRGQIVKPAWQRT
jgi:membrane protease YdiL (CAAX protease family)